MMQSENINELITALAKAQGEITPAIKDNLNPHFKSKYADLSSVWEACRLPLSKNGLAVVQTTEMINDKLAVITTLAHASGQWIKSHLPVLTATNTPQALGSALTYMRRYALSAITGVAPGDDDDAEAAMVASTEGQKKEKPKISLEQAVELGEILNSCDPQYVQTIGEYLQKIQIGRLEDLPVDLYQRLHPAALKKAQEFSHLQEIYE
jgi:ERF superfamily